MLDREHEPVDAVVVGMVDRAPHVAVRQRPRQEALPQRREVVVQCALQVVGPKDDADRVAAVAKADPGVAQVMPAMPGRGDNALLQVVPEEDPSDPAVGATIERLRSDLPAGTLVEAEDSSKVAKSGDWVEREHQGARFVMSNRPGDRLVFRFSGRHLAARVWTGDLDEPQRYYEGRYENDRYGFLSDWKTYAGGRAEILLDGQTLETLDLAGRDPARVAAMRAAVAAWEKDVGELASRP